MSAQDDLRAAAEHHQAGRLEAAEALYRRALAAMPDNPDLLHLLGAIARTRGRTEDAVGWLQAAAALRPHDAVLHADLADSLAAAEQPHAARRAYEHAVSLDPHRASAWYGLGNTLAVLGRMDAAVAAHWQAATADPAFTPALWALAMAGEVRALPRLEARLAQPGLAEADRINLHFAIARLLDQAGQHDAAFDHLRTANAALRAASGAAFDAAALREAVDARIAAFTPALLARRHFGGSASALPVFVVGMPRSGTTLVEQVLASHSQVCGVGERQDIADLVGALECESGSPDPAAWDAALCRHVAEGHLARLQAIAGRARCVVDKTPDNLFHLGAISLLFPAAHVIMCRRDPRDTCLSCYFQSFAWPMPYTSDLGACAERARQTERLMRHWESVLPVHTVQYEALVAAPEREARRLIRFLGLDWEPGCLDFHRTRRSVRSASQWQVRQPLYAGSVGRWRHYARHLAPLLDAFGRD